MFSTPALRLYPVVPGNTRMAVVDTVLPRGGGEDGRSPLLIPKNQIVQWSLFSMHRREDIWGADSNEFKPERWKSYKPGWVSQITIQPKRENLLN